MIPLEDNFSDIISKAQHGLRLTDTELAEKARVNSQTLRKLREGEFDELALLRIAPALGLAVRAREALAKHFAVVDERTRCHFRRSVEGQRQHSSIETILRAPSA